MSAPGPIVVGLGLLLGRSSTQLADFIRRTAELAAIIVSWAAYGATQKDDAIDVERKLRLERVANLCVGAAMCVGGAVMLLVAFLAGNPEKGNVIPGLIIAILGVLVNSWFWLRYRNLDRADPNAILAGQSRLYRVKTFVDACVTIALATIAVFPATPAAVYLDIAGSVVVAVYLIVNGMMTVSQQTVRADNEG